MPHHFTTRLRPKTNFSFMFWALTFDPMGDQFDNDIRAISKGDTSFAERFFRRPGGRRYLENLSLILIHTLAPQAAEKEEMYLGFVEVLDLMEERIRRQREDGELIRDLLPSQETED